MFTDTGRHLPGSQATTTLGLDGQKAPNVRLP